MQQFKHTDLSHSTIHTIDQFLRCLLQVDLFASIAVSLPRVVLYGLVFCKAAVKFSATFWNYRLRTHGIPPHYSGEAPMLFLDREGYAFACRHFIREGELGDGKELLRLSTGKLQREKAEARTA